MLGKYQLNTRTLVSGNSEVDEEEEVDITRVLSEEGARGPEASSSSSSEETVELELGASEVKVEESEQKRS